MEHLKKLLIGLTILFSFLFINNVNAENISFDKQHMFEYVTMTNTADLTNEEVIELLTNAGYAETQINKYIALRNYRIANNTEEKYYFLNPGDGVFFNSSRLMINMDDNAVQGFFTVHGSGTLYKIRYHIQSAYSSRTYYDAKLVDNIYSVYAYSTSGWIASQSDIFGFYLNADNTINLNINSTHLNYFYETNMNIDFFYNGGDFTDDMIIGENTYHNGSTLPINSLTGYNSLINKEPQLNISVIEKTDYLENIKINFNIWDTEKYIYQYKLTGMEVWEDITENDFEYISYSNNTIYIQMIDKTTNESILNATYTFSNITETIPDIIFNESIPNSCKVLKNGTNYIVCKEIKANFNNYYGINNYLWSYSADGENWTQIYNDKFVDLISENKAIYFKLYDRNTNETLKYMTYNITGIELIPTDLGQYITFNGKYENNNYKLDIIFYNYDNELYNYYYSTDGENWIQLNIGELSNYTSIYSKYKSFNFYKDMTIYVKIEDKEANYITSATYEIKIPNVGLFDTINNFKVDNKILNYFTNIYNQIRNSDLGNYVFILIVTSIILLIIKSARR